MAMAMPVSDMMCDTTPNCFIRINEIRIDAGSGRVTMSTERKCQRKRMCARVTSRISSQSACLSVSMAREMRSLRS